MLTSLTSTVRTHSYYFIYLAHSHLQSLIAGLSIAKLPIARAIEGAVRRNYDAWLVLSLEKKYSYICYTPMHQNMLQACSISQVQKICKIPVLYDFVYLHIRKYPTYNFRTSWDEKMKIMIEGTCSHFTQDRLSFLSTSDELDFPSTSTSTYY